MPASARICRRGKPGAAKTSLHGSNSTVSETVGEYLGHEPLQVGYLERLWHESLDRTDERSVFGKNGVVMGGQHYDRDIAAMLIGADVLQNFPTAHPWQGNIQDQQVVVASEGFFEPAGPSGTAGYLVLLSVETHLEQHACRIRVLDYQNLGFAVAQRES